MCAGMIGWAMALDYLVIPVVNVIYPALTFRRLFPHIPYAAWAALVTGAIVYMNLIGIRFTARANECPGRCKRAALLPV